MKTAAAILVETGKPLVIDELTVPALKPGQVLVELAYSGVCHTQLLEVRGHRGEDRFLPHCLGHEGSGTVVEIGAGVTRVKPGDRVVLSWIKAGGLDVPGTVYDWNGKGVNAGGVTTFGRHSVVSENRLFRVPEGTPMDLAALLGCAAPTGLGAVLNTAQPSPGQSLVVFGAGGVGLCAIMGARVAGCAPIIAVDLHADKLALARELGADHVLQAGEQDIVSEIKRLCPGGADWAIEATGRPAVMRTALESVRQQGGGTVVIGNAHHGEDLIINPGLLNQGKRLLGTWGGDTQPDRDFPRYLRLIESGRLEFASFLTHRYRLDEVNAALDDLEAGRVLRPILDLGAN